MTFIDKQQWIQNARINHNLLYIRYYFVLLHTILNGNHCIKRLQNKSWLTIKIEILQHNINVALRSPNVKYCSNCTSIPARRIWGGGHWHVLPCSRTIILSVDIQCLQFSPSKHRNLMLPLTKTFQHLRDFSPRLPTGALPADPTEGLPSPDPYLWPPCMNPKSPTVPGPAVDYYSIRLKTRNSARLTDQRGSRAPSRVQ